MRAVQASAIGGPEVLDAVEVPEPQVADDQVGVAVRVAGCNLADTGVTGDELFTPPDPPFISGSEVAGVNDDGHRVVALLPGAGGFAARVAAPADFVVEIPDAVDDGAAVALLRQGSIAWHAVVHCARLAPGESAIVQAAGGGIGMVALQLARHLGASPVVAVASTPEKQRLAADLGADTVLGSRDPDLVTRLLEVTGGGAHVGLHLACRRLFAETFAALRRGGRLVAYGTADGPELPPLAPRELVGRGLTVAGFALHHTLSDAQGFRQVVTELLTLAADGALRPVIDATFPLTEARAAHIHLRERPTGGKVLLAL